MRAAQTQTLHRGPIDWHQHRDGYLAVVLDGGYEEMGDQGRFRLSPGDALVHPPFERHANTVSSSGALVANIPLSLHDAIRLRSSRVADPAEFVRAACDGVAVAALLASACPIARIMSDEVDGLAETILHRETRGSDDDRSPPLMSPRSLRRHFQGRYGMSASSFRARTRACAALREIMIDCSPLATIAIDLGYADQAHMTRAIVRLTSRTPTQWRGSRL
jgi:hypothetical protein